jgi:hypothetical protein
MNVRNQSGGTLEEIKIMLIKTVSLEMVLFTIGVRAGRFFFFGE